MADKIATRQAYGEALIELVEKNDKVVVLDADLANATQTCKVAKAHPEKFYNCGIAEANMVDIAAGRCKPFRRSLLRPQEKIVHMEHCGGKPLRKLRSKRRFARAAVAVNGKDPARRGVQFFVQL